LFRHGRSDHTLNARTSKYRRRGEGDAEFLEIAADRHHRAFVAGHYLSDSGADYGDAELAGAGAFVPCSPTTLASILAGWTWSLSAGGHDAVHWVRRQPEGGNGRLIYGRAGRFDVVHFHDLGDAFSPWTVLAVACLSPTVWTLRDCSPFTGGCLYPMDCGRFARGCGACSAHLKRFVHAAARVKAIAPCAWMADLAVASRRVRERPVIVPYGMNKKRFRPTADRATLRRSLGLPEERPVFLVSSMRISEPRKGVAHALRAVAALAELSPVVVAIGAHPEVVSMIPYDVEVGSRAM
jgi:glycosyltransferase involved in cell wall biosynthesis